MEKNGKNQENEPTVDTLALKQEQDSRLSNAITSALEMDKLFRLYSYRIISPVVFIDAVDAEMKRYSEFLKDVPYAK